MNNDEIIVFILERIAEKEMSLILKERTHAIEVLGSSDNVSVCVLKSIGCSNMIAAALEMFRTYS